MEKRSSGDRRIIIARFPNYRSTPRLESPDSFVEDTAQNVLQVKAIAQPFLKLLCYASSQAQQATARTGILPTCAIGRQDDGLAL